MKILDPYHTETHPTHRVSRYTPRFTANSNLESGGGGGKVTLSFCCGVMG